MNLHRLTLHHFRQFYGTQTVDFVTARDRMGPNVTVIFGETGRGKTGLFRAIVFCLFGERRLSQDGDIPDNELHFVNSTALRESVGRPVDAHVELSFEHDRDTYSLRRSVRGMMRNEQVQEEMYEVDLRVTRVAGNTECIAREDIGHIVDGILDRRVKEYFLFDGEKIERLTRANPEQRKEVANGIRNLLKVDALEKAWKVMDKLTKELDTQVASTTTTELARILKQMQANEEAQKLKKGNLDQTIDEADKARAEISRVDKELAKYAEVKDFVTKRHNLEDQLASLEQRLEESRGRMRGLATKAAILLLMPTARKVYSAVDEQKKRGDVPSEIRRELIDKILAEAHCICGNEVCQGTEAFERILVWRNKATDSETQESALGLWRWLGELESKYSGFKMDVETELVKHCQVRNSIEETHKRLSEIAEKIGKAEREDASRLERQRQELESKRADLEALGRLLQEEINSLAKKFEELEAHLKTERQRATLLDDRTRRALLARETRDALKNVYESFANEVKEITGNSASEILPNLLDKQGNVSLRKIVVKKDYSLEVLDRWGNPFLADISAGQRQIVSISFISALAKVAVGGDKMQMPFFMDTPFGRLSSEHRENLIRFVPELCSQWIILATDTEFTQQEARLLAISGRWGRFYRLRSDEKGNSRIEPIPIDQVPAILADRSSME